jgi:hypothetical protein
MKTDPDKFLADLAPHQPAGGRKTCPRRSGAGAGPFAAAPASPAGPAVWVVALALSFACQPAQAQSNLDAGKSPARIFADTCGACHRSPRELKRTSTEFMREHYTTGIREATAMAAYLAGIGSDPRAVSQRKPPVLGAGQAAPAQQGSDQAKSENQAALPGAASVPGTDQPKPAAAIRRSRRPSESVEAGLPSSPADAAGNTAAAGSQAAATPGTRPNPAEEFEE